MDTERFGPMGGPATYGEAMGRMSWLDGPMAASDFDGKGTWAPGPAPDPQGPGSPSPAPMMGGYGSSPLLDAVEAKGDGGRWFG